MIGELPATPTKILVSACPSAVWPWRLPGAPECRYEHASQNSPAFGTNCRSSASRIGSDRPGRRQLLLEPLQRHTLETYASMLDVHIVPRLGQVRLRSLTPELIGELRAEMAADGVGGPAIHKTLVLQQSILERAVEWRRLDSNPARVVRKPSQARPRVVRPLPPQTIEAMRAHLLRHDRQLAATMIAVLACAGLRPWRSSRRSLA